LRTLLVGSLEQLYKGPDVLLRALAHCKAAGLDVRTTLIGDGRKRPSLEALAGELGLADRVHFTGRLPPGSAIRDQMDRADVFVLPSLTEGLPRAMLEAMARGLPCIGSRVGGIPELLPDEDLVDPGDSAALADKLISVAADADRLREMAARNLLKARQYHADVLRPRRRDLYAHLRAATENWLRIQA
jgi:glycosyltransferase involved in cell wall biosynthesis